MFLVRPTCTTALFQANKTWQGKINYLQGASKTQNVSKSWPQITSTLWFLMLLKRTCIHEKFLWQLNLATPIKQPCLKLDHISEKCSLNLWLSGPNEIKAPVKDIVEKAEQYFSFSSTVSFWLLQVMSNCSFYEIPGANLRSASPSSLSGTSSDLVSLYLFYLFF